MAKSEVERSHLLRIRALLRRKDICRAVCAEERISYITRGSHGHVERFFRRNYVLNIRERSSDGHESISVFIKEYESELRCHSRAAVVGCAAAEAEDYPLCAALLGVAHEHTYARRGCNCRVGSVARERKSRA